MNHPVPYKPLELLRRLHRDERGAEGLEKLLIIGAVVIPLVALLIIFRNKISEWVSGDYETVRNDSQDGMTFPEN